MDKKNSRGFCCFFVIIEGSGTKKGICKSECGDTKMKEGGDMSGKGHVTVHHIEMYLEEKISKRKLQGLKDKFKQEILQENSDLADYEKNFESYVYEDEYKIYLERNEKNIDILEALKKIFPEDDELQNLDI